jgi:hypothetical protein
MPGPLGLKSVMPGFNARGTAMPEYQVTPDEIDQYVNYNVVFPSGLYSFLATAASGTAGVGKVFVIKNKVLDYPRNVSVNVTATADFGGTATINGKDQFGNSISESIGFSTAAAGTPGGHNEGTKIFAEFTSGTFTGAGSGGGLANLGYGTSEGSVKFGLPVKIGAVTDVKKLTWVKEFVNVTFAGGTLSSSHVDTTNHAIVATAALGGTEAFSVTVKPTYDASGDTTRQAGL